jgi:hypothetical protein
MLELWNGTRKNDKHQLLTRTYIKPNTSWLVHSSSTIDVKASQGQLEFTRLCAYPWDRHLNDILSQDYSQVGVSKNPKLGLQWLWGCITFCANLRLRCGQEQSCSLCLEISNVMLHVICTQGNRGDSWLLVVGSQMSIWLLTLLLAITYVLDVQMGHANPF